LAVRAVIDVTSIDHIVGSNDVEIKLTRDEEGEMGVIFAVEDTVVRLSPIEGWVSYILHEIMEASQELLAREEQKPGWRAKNKD